MTDDVLPNFVAIDFETANRSPRSAVALGVVVVREGSIAEQCMTLLRPPTRRIGFTSIHGIQARDVADAPDFGTAWPTIAPHFRRVQFVAAHHAAFDQAVLAACCSAARVTMPRLPFLCTVALARRTWGFVPTTLPEVCRRLEIPLVHHHAISDAEACAQIVRAAWGTSAGREWIRRTAG